MPEILVMGSMKAQPGKEDATREALEAIVAPTHTEDGCLLYALHQGLEDSTRFALIERWESQEALDAHIGNEHLAAVLARADELLAEPPDAVAYRPLPQGATTKGSLAGHAA